MVVVCSTTPLLVKVGTPASSSEQDDDATTNVCPSSSGAGAGGGGAFTASKWASNSRTKKYSLLSTVVALRVRDRAALISWPVPCLFFKPALVRISRSGRDCNIAAVLPQNRCNVTSLFGWPLIVGSASNRNRGRSSTTRQMRQHGAAAVLVSTPSCTAAGPSCWLPTAVSCSVDSSLADICW